MKKTHNLKLKNLYNNLIPNLKILILLYIKSDLINIKAKLQTLTTVLNNWNKNL